MYHSPGIGALDDNPNDMAMPSKYMIAIQSLRIL
jgi:hypothetical protein